MVVAAMVVVGAAVVVEAAAAAVSDEWSPSSSVWVPHAAATSASAATSMKVLTIGATPLGSVPTAWARSPRGGSRPIGYDPSSIWWRAAVARVVLFDEAETEADGNGLCSR